MEAIKKSVSGGAGGEAAISLHEQLEKEVWDICDVLFVAQENLKVLSFLWADDADPDRLFFKRKSMYFDFTRKMTWRLVIVELYKLFSEREAYSLRTLFTRLNTGGSFASIIPSSKIEAWEKQLVENSDLIRRVRNQRNKSVAHKDRSGLDEKTNGITLNEAKQLVEIVQGVAKAIYREVTGSSFMVESPINSPVEDLDKILTALARDRKIFLEPLRSEGRKYGLDELAAS